MTLAYSANILRSQIQNVKTHIGLQRKQIEAHQQKISSIQGEIDKAVQRIVELESAIKELDPPKNVCSCGGSK